MRTVAAWNTAEGVAVLQVDYQGMNRLHGDCKGENVLVLVRTVSAAQCGCWDKIVVAAFATLSQRGCQ